MDATVDTDTDSGVDVTPPHRLFDGGYSVADYAIAIAGDACSKEGATACTGHYAAGTLACAGDPLVWTEGESCGSDFRCDTRFGEHEGTCQSLDYHCWGRNPGDLACEGELSPIARGRCTLDLVAVEDAPDKYCPGQTKCDPNAGASCGCDPGFAVSSGDICIEVGACVTNHGGCLAEATCKYSYDASPVCRCPAAHVGDGITACTQVWTREFGGPGADNAPAIASDASGSVYVAGITEGGFDGLQVTGQSAGFVVKFDATGAKQWAKLISSDKSKGYIYGLVSDANGDFYVSGYTDGDIAGGSGGSYGAFIIKLDSAGVVKWSRQNGGGIAVDASGDLYVARSTYGSSGHDSDILVIKYSSDGQELWSRQFGGDGNQYGGSATPDASGNVYVGGSGVEPDASDRSDLLLLKYDSAGNLLWSRRRDLSEADAAGKIFIAGDGTLLVNASYDTPLGASASRLLRYDSAGQELSAPPLTGISAVDSSGNLFSFRSIFGAIDPYPTQGLDVLLAKYDGTGQELWHHVYGSTGSEAAGGFAIDPSGNMFLAGSTDGIDGYTSAGSTDVFVLKVDSSGNEL